ncbi:MAG: hypothetical protein ACI4XR_01435 [Bacilli bacterium]
MSSLNSINLKLDKIKKAIGNNGIDLIYIWIEEDKPIRFDLIYKNGKKIENIYCNSMDEYLAIKEKYSNVKMLEFIGVKKPEPEDVAVA